jgi:hypothetical protein
VHYPSSNFIFFCVKILFKKTVCYKIGILLTKTNYLSTKFIMKNFFYPSHSIYDAFFLHQNDETETTAEGNRHSAKRGCASQEVLAKSSTGRPTLPLRMDQIERFFFTKMPC